MLPLMAHYNRANDSMLAIKVSGKRYNQVTKG